MRLSGVESSDTARNLHLPGGICTRLRLRLHADEKAVGKSNTLVCGQNERVVREGFKRGRHEGTVWRKVKRVESEDWRENG